MIKVMNIISDTNIGGAGRVILNYLRYCDKTAFDVSVAVPRASELIAPLREAGGRVIEIDGIADKSLDMAAISSLREAIRRENPDIVHTHGSMAGRIAGRREKKKVIYTRHSVFPVKSYMAKGPGRWANKIVNEHYADKIIAVSEAAAQNLTDGGISRKKITVILNGVEAQKRVSEEECRLTREKYSIPEGVFTAGIMARIEEYKGHLDILDAVKTVTDSGRRMKLIIAGTGAFEDTVKKRAAELGLDDAVVFAGFVSDVAPILSILDVQLNASYGTEATSLALLEGFSMGVPAVISDYGGNPYLIVQGANGYTFPTRDSDALADRLNSLIDAPEKLKTLSRGAEHIYRERFTGEIFARNIEHVYRELMEGK